MRPGAARPQRLELGVISPVHSDHVVEVVKVAEAHLACLESADVEPAPAGLGLGPRIGRLADVVVPGAGRIDRDSIAEAMLGDKRPEHPLGARRAAYVAEADEQNFDHAPALFDPTRRMTLAEPMRIVILTGAGISAESGLGTFRDTDGLWTRYDLEQVATPEGFARDPALVHNFYNARRRNVTGAEPNAAHAALARLERDHAGDVMVVTQNVDDLHERAGGRNVVHMHGELLKARCTACRHVLPWTEDLGLETACPACEGHGSMRPHVVWFGEMPMAMERIDAALEACDLFLSIGTSGSVYPAAGFVAQARAAGSAHTVELNLEPSEGHSLFAETLYGPASEVVPAYIARLLRPRSVETVIRRKDT